jgi:hypothetical protein
VEGVEPRWEHSKEPPAEVETINIASRLCHLPLEVIRSLFDPQQNTLDLTVKTPFASGQEVYNTYGEGMGWAKQACEWGFIDESIEGDGALGKGLKWELADVLSRDDDDFESVKGEWKRLCKEDNPQDDVTAQDGETSPRGITEAESDSLFFSPTSGDSPKDCLLLNEDGQLSLPLFWAIACKTIPTGKDKRGFSEALDALGHGPLSEDETSVRSHRNSSVSKTKAMAMREIARGVIELCESRISKTRYTAQSTSELCDMLDGVSSLALKSFKAHAQPFNPAISSRPILEPYRPEDLNCRKKSPRGRHLSME